MCPEYVEVYDDDLWLLPGAAPALAREEDPEFTPDREVLLDGL